MDYSDNKIIKTIGFIVFSFLLFYVIYKILVFMEVPIMYVSEYMVFYIGLMILYFFIYKPETIW